jgi:hypothetical protein
MLAFQLGQTRKENSLCDRLRPIGVLSCADLRSPMAKIHASDSIGEVFGFLREPV